ncbi:MAG: ABC transporter permease [Flavobacteriales bacterium]|nr:ABC transporter permease [Flavobacteriales bacterium]MCB9448200.1 ABC transporter permease [Flavobacteriales bacterium]
MGKYFLRRILIFIPTLVLITLLGFTLSQYMPGDPVDRLLTSASAGGELLQQSQSMQQQKRLWRHKLGLDLPVFYVHITSLAEPDTLYRIYPKSVRNAMERLIATYGNWPEIQQYRMALEHLTSLHNNLDPDSGFYAGAHPDSVLATLNRCMFESTGLLSIYDPDQLEVRFKQLATDYGKYACLRPFASALADVRTALGRVREHPAKWKAYVPVLRFYGNNQYHRWMFGDGEFSRGILRGDFGISFVNRQPISNILPSRIGWSLFFTLISVVLSYLISIPIGIRSAVKRHSRFDRLSSLFLFILYSLPGFWVATLLLMTFANPDILPWLPASGIAPPTGFPDGSSWWSRLMTTLPYLVLPVICYTYSSFAFLSRTMRISMIEVQEMDFIRTARAKGLGEGTVIYRHALRNALLPIITVFTNLFPYAIGGSVILETIFTIPGMGLEMYEAIMSKDHPVIIAVLTLSGVLTLVGFLLADMLYAIADPRITYDKK